MNYNLEHYVCMNLLRLGHEVKFYGYKERLGRLANLIRMGITRSKLARDAANLLWLNKINDEMKKIAGAFRPDLVLSIKGEAVKPETIEWFKEELGVKTALWYPDDPRFFHSLVRYIAPNYDHVFTTSERTIEAYKEAGCKDVHFLPFACEPDVHKKVNPTEEEKKKYETDMIFVGTYTRRRARLIGALKKAGVKMKVYGPYWKYFHYETNIYDGIYGPEMVKAFNVAKIVLNIHIQDDLPYKVNMRTFEATGSGAFLLTDMAYWIKKMFGVGKELVVYKNEDELVKAAKYYLKAEDERLKIAYKGMAKAHERHNYYCRVSDLLSKVKG
jgi:spore maturation protein CgeB